MRARQGIYDDEYTKAVSLAQPPLGVAGACVNPDDDSRRAAPTKRYELIAHSSTAPALKRAAVRRSSFLTSGTTG